MAKIIPITDSDYGQNPDYGSEIRIRIIDPDYGSGLRILIYTEDKLVHNALKIDQDLP